MKTGSCEDDELHPDYVIVVQCHRVVHDVCSGFKCESAFHARTGGFLPYPIGVRIRYLPLSCGGCPGLMLERRLRVLRKELEGHALRSVVHLSTCMTHNANGVASCAFVDSIRERITKVGFTIRNHSHLSSKPGGMQTGRVTR